MALNRILIAVDEERFATETVDFALNYKWPANVAFRLLHVVELSPVFDVSEPVIEESRKSAADLLKKLADLIRHAIPAAQIEETIVVGHAKDEIVTSARAWNADLVVVGSHGRRSLLGLGIFPLGSVSQAVSSHAPCSVVIVRLPREADTADAS